MRRYLIAALLPALVAGGLPAHAWIAAKSGGGGGVTPSAGQLLVSNSSGTLSGSAARYIPIGYSAGTSFSVDSQFMNFPVAGTLKSIRFYTVTAPAGAATWTATARLNGSATALTCQITSASSGKCSAATNVAVSAGAWGSIQISPAGTPTASIVSVAIVFEPTTANDTILPAQLLNSSNVSTFSTSPFSNGSPGTPANRRYNSLPDGGTLDRLHVFSNAPGAGTSYAYTLDKNATTTALTCTIADTATSCADTSNSFTVVAGDDLQFQAAPTNTPTTASAALGARYRPTTTGSFPLMKDGIGTDHSATLTTYYPLTGGASVGSTTEANAQSISEAMTLTKMTLKLSAAPGAGKSRTYVLRKNGVDTSLTCTVSDANTTNACTGSVFVAAGDLLSTADVPTGTPTVGANATAISYLGNM